MLRPVVTYLSGRVVAGVNVVQCRLITTIDINDEGLSLEGSNTVSINDSMERRGEHSLGCSMLLSFPDGSDRRPFRYLHLICGMARAWQLATGARADRPLA